MQLQMNNYLCRQPSHNAKIKHTSLPNSKQYTDDEEERRLSKLLFGTEVSDEVFNKQITPYSKIVEKPISFEIDRDGREKNDTVNYIPSKKDVRTNSSNLNNHGNKSEDISVWFDSDDERLQVSLARTSLRIRKLRNRMEEDSIDGVEFQRRLREQYLKTTGKTIPTDWANLHNEHNTTRCIYNQEEVFSSNKKILSYDPTKIPPHVIDIKRIYDGNLCDPNSSVVQSVQFHRGRSDIDEYTHSGSLNYLSLMTAGTDKMLRFFRVDIRGEEKPIKTHGVYFHDMPIYCASYLGDTGNIVLSGKKPYFYFYDGEKGKVDKTSLTNVPNTDKSLDNFTTSSDGSLLAFATGQGGYISFVDGRSKTWITDMKMNGSAKTVRFEKNDFYLLSCGSDGDIYRWDMRNYKCCQKFSNIDGSIIYSLATSNSNHIAVGSESGCINLYKIKSDVMNPTPFHTILNLRTSVNNLLFHPQSQVLVMSSRMEKDSLKLYHVPSQTVFSNWPTNKTPLGYVCSLDFSPGKGKLLAIGNDKGRCLLYQLKRFFI